MTQNICNIILLNHCCCNFAMFPDTFMELVWKLQLLQMFVAVLQRARHNKRTRHRS